MINCPKSHPPRLLVWYSKQEGASYKEMDSEVKKAVKSHLLRDQHHLCAYCMKEISLESMRIEHWVPQQLAPCKALDYRNMLGVCNGDIYQCEPNTHCDRSKGGNSIKYNPSTDANVESRLKYVGGRIFSDETEWDEHLNSVLKLNCGRLPEARNAALISFINSFSKGRNRVTWNTHAVRRIACDVLENDDDKYPEYFGIIKYYCRKLKK